MSSFPTNMEVIQRAHMVSLSGQSCNIINTFHYGCTDTITPDATYLNTFVGAWKASINSIWITCLSIAYTPDGVDIRWMDDSTSPATQFGSGNALGGGTVGTLPTALAPNLTAFIKLGTAKRGKSFRGSKHFSPLDGSQVSQGELIAGMVSQYEALKIQLLTPIIVGPNTWVLTVMSPSLSDLSNPTKIIANAAITAKTDVNKTLGDQKSRKFKRLFI